MYFFNRYSASLNRSNGEKMTQTFLINKGKGIDTGQAIKLLQGRALIAELTNSKGEAYKPWVQLDFTKKDDYGNNHMNKYGEGYGYNLRDAVAKFQILELDGGEKEAALLSALQKGEVPTVTFDNAGTEEKYMIEANPARKTINVYEEGFKMKKHEELPLAIRLQTSQKQTDDPKNGQAVGEKNTTAKENDSKLLNKNRTRQNKGAKVA